MASSSLLLLVVSLSAALASASACFDAIFSFGDSLADTGNLIRTEQGNHSHGARAGHLPYGITYFHGPTGRFSDGRLVIDFIAESMGLPLLPPYLGGGDFQRGVNFAVAGATALPNDFFRERGMHATWTEYSLSSQVDWFKDMLPTLCSSETDCSNILSRSLFLVGEIGGNDYNHPFRQGKTIDEIRTFVPDIVNSISSTINDLVKLGARTLVVPGNFPIGCMPSFLELFENSKLEDYDSQTGCIKWLNDLSIYHNGLLQDELNKLRHIHPYATIIYADYYEAAMAIFRSPNQFGFNNIPLCACCGGGGLYNYNPSILCGEEGMSTCNDPSSYISWDGRHLTEAAYRIIAHGLLEGPYAHPPIRCMSPQKDLVAEPIQQGLISEE